MTPKPFSKEAERGLVRALDEVVNLVNAGSSPNDAVTKVATARKIPAGHISLMVQAYNTSRSETQRHSSRDVLEKAAEFELADTAIILSRMFPDQVKSAGEERRQTEVSDEYQRSPTFLANRRSERLLKQGEAIDWRMIPEPPPPLPTCPDSAARRVHSKAARLVQRLEEARREAQITFDHVNQLIEKLGVHLSTAGAPPFAEVRDNVSTLFGSDGTLLMDRVAASRRQLTKQASRSTGAPVCMDQPPYDLVKAILDGATIALSMAEEFEKVAAEKLRFEQEELRPFVLDEPAHGSVLGPSYPTCKEAFFGTLVGSVAGTAMARELVNRLGSRPTQDLETKMKQQLTDPQHEAEIRNVQTGAMLNDLMANDEVIASHDPGEVLNHFNEISQLAPRATNQQGLMRALLRKRLQQGALDPYEVDMLLKIENGLKTRDTQGPSAGVLSRGNTVLA